MTDTVKVLSDDDLREIEAAISNGDSQSAYMAASVDNVRALVQTVRSLRQRLFGNRQVDGCDHSTACSLWGDDGQGHAEGFAELPPCNCGALINFERKQNTALREQLALLRERDELKDQLAQVTQERDGLQEQLAEEIAKRINSNTERMGQSQKVTQAELERHCSDDRLPDTQRGSYQD